MTLETMQSGGMTFDDMTFDSMTFGTMPSDTMTFRRMTFDGVAARVAGDRAAHAESLVDDSIFQLDNPERDIG
ncbi:MAG: hypothetical protein ACTHOH_08875 [Lysobacteraceae bacterium]